jgi:DNA polymerase-3 subunit delta'
VTVLVTSSPDELLATVRSRCQRIDLAPLGEATVIRALVAEGHDEQAAAWGARVAGDQLGRARALLGDQRPLRDAFVDAVGELDGSGAAAARVAAILDTSIKDAIVMVRARHASELAEFDVAAERAGYPPRAVATQRRRMTTRHERHERIARRDALVEGITALETVYRDVLAGAGAGAMRRNLDREPLTIEARACVRALDACRTARQSLERNPNEGLLLEWLALHLSGGRPTPNR